MGTSTSEVRSSSPPRSTAPTRTSRPAPRPESTEKPATEKPPPDRATVSQEAREKNEYHSVGSLLGSMRTNYKPYNGESSEHAGNASAVRTLQRNFSIVDNPDGGETDDRASVGDLQDVASGDYNKTAARQFLQERGVENPNQELHKLEDSAQQLASDSSAFDYVESVQTGETDGLISSGDTARAGTYLQTDRLGARDSQARYNEISQIAQMPEDQRVERNDEINRIYNEQAKELRDLIGPEGGANWLAYATQASAGVGEVLKGNVKFGPIEASEEAKAALGDGNRRVFEEVTPITERFLSTFENGKQDPKKWESFADSFQPGQENLKEAFRSYYEAMGTDDVQAKQEAVLKGNLLIGQHEQGRLDPNLDKAFEAKTSSGLANDLLGAANDVVPIDDLKPDSIQNGLIELRWGGGFAQPVGDDVQTFDRNAGRDNRVDDYNTIRDPGLQGILDEWRDRGSDNGDPNSLSGTNASNWADFDERMYFISELFRNTQLDPGLYELPA